MELKKKTRTYINSKNITLLLKHSAKNKAISLLCISPTFLSKDKKRSCQSTAEIQRCNTNVDTLCYHPALRETPHLYPQTRHFIPYPLIYKSYNHSSRRLNKTGMVRSKGVSPNKAMLGRLLLN